MSQEEFLQKQIWKLEDQIIAERKQHEKEKHDLLIGFAKLLGVIIVVFVLLLIRVDHRHQAEIEFEREMAVQEYTECLNGE